MSMSFVAVSQDSHFPIQKLTCGVFALADGVSRIGDDARRALEPGLGNMKGLYSARVHANASLFEDE